MRCRRSASALAIAAMLLASVARADIGVLPTVVEGFADPKIAQRRQEDLDSNIRETLLSTRVPLTLKCDGGSFDHAPDAKCVKDAVIASSRDVDEVAQVLLRSVGASKTVMKLRIFGRDGAVLQEPTQELIDVQASEVTTVMLRKAFDPSRFSAEVTVTGASPGTQLLVDGLPVSPDTKLPLRVGSHVLEVVHQDGAVEKLPFEVALDKAMTVAVPSSAPAAVAPSAGMPFYVSASTAGAGALTTLVSAVLLVVAVENRDEWRRRAIGRTFPRNGDDPHCKASANGCLDEDGGKIGWTIGYGPLGEANQVGQGARFMMVAISRDNELRWTATSDGSLGGIIAGAAALIAGTVNVLALWPATTAADSPGEGEGAAE